MSSHKFDNSTDLMTIIALVGEPASGYGESEETATVKSFGREWVAWIAGLEEVT